MKASVYDMNTWLYADDRNRADGRAAANVEVARNSYACFQVLLEECPVGEITWKMAGHGMPGEVSVRRLRAVYVGKNTGPEGFTATQPVNPKDVARVAPFWVYDAMSAITGEAARIKETDVNAALYVMIRVADTVRPGDYLDTLLIEIAGEQAAVPVVVRAARAVVPKQETLQIINWFRFDCMAKYHHVEMWSEEHWEVIRRYGEMMRHGRQTHFWITKELVECRENADGGFSFDFSRALRLMRMYFDMGFRWLESGMVIERRMYEDQHFIIRTGARELDALSPEGYRYLADYFRQLRALLAQNGWLENTVQHVADEPHAGCAEEYRVLAGIVRMLMPGVPLIDAVEIHDLYGAVDIIVPKNHYYEAHRAQFEAYRRMGNTLWCYTCCNPGGAYMNRTLDFSLLRTRYMHWGNYVYDLKGYLHWGLNWYDYTDDPFCSKAGQAQNLGEVELPPGDTHILYPDVDGPMSSVRFEAMRAGIEDYELLCLAAARSRDAADAIARSCVRGFGDFDESTARFAGAYRRLLAAAAP